MKDTFTSDGSDDFRRRYEHTFGWIILRDVKTFAEIREVSDSAVYFSLGSGRNFHINADKDIIFEFAPLNRAWYNTPVRDEVYLVERSPARQWKRGICSANTTMCDSSLNQIEITYEKLKLVYDPISPYFMANDDITEYQNIALSPHFAVLKGSLYFYSDCIGKLHGNRIILSNAIVYQEIADLIRRNRLDLNVEILE